VEGTTRGRRLGNARQLRSGLNFFKTVTVVAAAGNRTVYNATGGNCTRNGTAPGPSRFPVE
jgi:hypothetical protein